MIVAFSVGGVLWVGFFEYSSRFSFFSLHTIIAFDSHCSHFLCCFIDTPHRR